MMFVEWCDVGQGGMHVDSLAGQTDALYASMTEYKCTWLTAGSGKGSKRLPPTTGSSEEEFEH